MIKYSEDEIIDILKSILERNDFIIEPIGNHHLNRHVVYKISFLDGEKLVFKLYYITQRRSRELASLRELKSTNIKCPRVVKYGIVNGFEWVLLSYIEGELFDRILPNMNYDESLFIFNQIGEELGRLHSLKTYHFIGEWDENGECIAPIKDFKSDFISKTEAIIEDISKKALPDKVILMEAITQIRKNYENVKLKLKPRLIHGDFDGRNIIVIKSIEGFKVSGIIDFEMSYPGNYELDFVGLYFRYFLENTDFEKAFFDGYNKFLEVEKGFKNRLYIYLLRFALGNCSWSIGQAPDYYNANIKLLKILIAS